MTRGFVVTVVELDDAEARDLSDKENLLVRVLSVGQVASEVVAAQDAELASRRAKLEKDGFPIPESQTPWQELQRRDVDQLAQGMVLKSAVKYQRIAQSKGVPRDNH